MSNKIRWNLNKVIDFIKSNSDCELISEEFSTSKDKLIFKCKCGNDFITSFQSFNLKNKRQCDKCGMKTMKSKQSLSYEDVLKYVTDNSNCELISNTYVNSKSLLQFKCECGNTFERSYEKFKTKNKNCKECSYKKVSINQTYSYEYVKSIVESNDCKLISDKYEGCYEKLDIKCYCGEIFKVNFTAFTKNNQIRCKICTNSTSKGELAIKKFLRDNNINFEEQFKFKDLKADNNKHFLKFDFCIFNDDKDIISLLEFDGLQHDKPVEFYGGIKAYEVLKKNDESKNNYCIKNNLKLIRIGYKDLKNIESILSNNLFIQK